MPVISVTLLPGYSSEAESRLVQRVAIAARSVIAAAPAGTTVFVQQASTYQRDDKVFGSGGSERPDASALVHGFLDRMQQRDLAAAQALLAPDFQMTFPGAPAMQQLEQLVQWSRSRYLRVEKVYARFDECWTGDGAIVYCFGQLHGTWLDGSAFEGIRFIDRFDVRDGKICRQDVWNDMALHPMPAAPAAQ